MTDEEMAEEYKEQRRFVSIDDDADVVMTQNKLLEYIKQAFLAGLKAGKLKWHDLRKDPNDLPLKMGIGSEVVLISYDGEVTDFAYYNFKSKRWEHDEDDFYICTPPPIAWCEIPKFEGRNRNYERI